MNEHLAELVRHWFDRYQKAGEAISRSRALHAYLLAKDAREKAAAKSADDKPEA